MIRLVLLISILAVPAAAQTALTERPGRWISVPREEAPSVQAPVLEAPASGPLITAAPAPVVELSAPEVVTAVVPPRARPDTRPVPRPRVIELAVVVEPEPEPEPIADVAPIAEPAPIVESVLIVEPVPIEVAAAPSVRPLPRPRTDAAAAMAEAIAAQLADDARAIMAAPRVVPVATRIAPEEALAPVRAVVIPEVVIPEIVLPEAVAPEALAPAVAPELPPRSLTPPTVVPLLAAALSPVPLSIEPAAMAAVLLPARARTARPVAQPVAFIAPPIESTPILPRLRPSGPVASEALAPLRDVAAARLSAVLIPSVAGDVPRVPHLARALVPAFDPFPMSALPPSALAEGPYSMGRAIQPPRPFAESNAAVLTGAAPVVLARMPIPSRAAVPEAETPVTDPDAAVELPAPDVNALARMMEDAMICWRLADLSMEAQWARLSVDVALDETNVASAESIRFTGFAHVVSGAAEDAYRAAHGALMGCAGASANAPATASATLIFDRNGVRLQ